MAVIKIGVVLSDLILEIDSWFYGTFVTTDKKGEKVIIVRCMNTIYGMMVDSLLYYKKFVKKLRRSGLKLNPYDPCVENIPVNNNQKTTCFHVENCKLIHQDSEVNDEFINTLHDEYESVFEDGYGKMKVS